MHTMDAENFPVRGWAVRQFASCASWSRSYTRSKNTAQKSVRSCSYPLFAPSAEGGVLALLVSFICIFVVLLAIISCTSDVSLSIIILLYMFIVSINTCRGTNGPCRRSWMVAVWGWT